mgnify:CR=1 FL=1
MCKKKEKHDMKQKTYFIEMEKCVSGKYYTDEESQNIPTFDKIKSAYKWVYKYNKQKKSLKNDYIFHIISEEKNVDQDPILKEEANLSLSAWKNAKSRAYRHNFHKPNKEKISK